MIIREEYEQEHAYQMFLLHEMKGQAEIERYINEAVVLTEGVNIADNMAIINEGFIEGVKERLNKLAAFIKKMWAKFLEVMNRLVRTNNSYLVKYKDIILKRKFNEDDSADMYDWKVGHANIMTPVVVAIPDEKTLVKEMESKDAFIAKHFPSFVSGYKQPYEFADICKSYFRGGDDLKTFNANELNTMIKDMYDYCLTYGDKTKNFLEKDHNAFMRQAGQLMDDLLKAEKNATNNPPESGQQANGESSIWDEEKFYSSIYESYITEEDATNGGVKVNDKRAASDADRAAAKPGTTTVKVNDKRAVNNNGSKEPPKGSGSTATIGNKDQQNNNNPSSKIPVSPTGNGESVEDIKKLGNAVSDFVDLINTCLTTRMSAAEAMYKDYMKIIRYHVSNNVGTNDKSKVTVGKMGTTDNNIQNNNNQNTNNNGNNNQNTNNNGNGFK